MDGSTDPERRRTPVPWLRPLFAPRQQMNRVTPVSTHNLSVAVLGAGHGGLALAAYLSTQGHRVALWNRSPDRLAPVEALGGIHLTVPGTSPTFAPIGMATTHMASVLSSTRRVLVAVPASAHAEVARECAPY